MISAFGDARRSLGNSIEKVDLPSVMFPLGEMLIVSRIGELPSRNFMNPISCGTPDIQVIFTILSRSNM